MRERIDQIDALRGIAALAVAMIYHVHVALGGHRTSPLDGIQPFTWLHAYGWSMVDLFFVISGYVFAHVYLDEQGQLRSGSSVRNFAVARFARLYPLHVVALFAVAGITLWAASRGIAPANNDAKHFLLGVLFLQESGLNDGFSFNAPAWSLSVEAYCYAIFILAAATRRLAAVSIVAILVGVSMDASDSLSASFVGRGLVGFFVGHWLWRGRRLNIPPLYPAAIAMAFLFASVVRPLLIPALFSLALWPALILVSLNAKWLAMRPLRWLGERSYSIYLIHFPLFMAQHIAWGGKAVPWPGMFMALNLVALLFLADLSFRFLERPAQRSLLAMGGARLGWTQRRESREGEGQLHCKG